MRPSYSDERSLRPCRGTTIAPRRRATLRQTLLEQAGPFELQQLLLAVEAAGVADEAAGGADDAVAGEHDRDRIPVHHRSHGPRSPRAPDARGKVAVCRDLAERHPGELAQDVPGELGRAGQVDGEVERLAPPGEVLVELTLGPVHGTRSAEHARPVDAGEPL